MRTARGADPNAARCRDRRWRSLRAWTSLPVALGLCLLGCYDLPLVNQRCLDSALDDRDVAADGGDPDDGSPDDGSPGDGGPDDRGPDGTAPDAECSAGDNRCSSDNDRRQTCQDGRWADLENCGAGGRCQFDNSGQPECDCPPLSVMCSTAGNSLICAASDDGLTSLWLECLDEVTSTCPAVEPPSRCGSDPCPTAPSGGSDGLPVSCALDAEGGLGRALIRTGPAIQADSTCAATPGAQQAMVIVNNADWTALDNPTLIRVSATARESSPDEDLRPQLSVRAGAPCGCGGDTPVEAACRPEAAPPPPAGHGSLTIRRPEDPASIIVSPRDDTTGNTRPYDLVVADATGGGAKTLGLPILDDPPGGPYAYRTLGGDMACSKRSWASAVAGYCVYPADDPPPVDGPCVFDPDRLHDPRLCLDNDAPIRTVEVQWSEVFTGLDNEGRPSDPNIGVTGTLLPIVLDPTRRPLTRSADWWSVRVPGSGPPGDWPDGTWIEQIGRREVLDALQVRLIDDSDPGLDCFGCHFGLRLDIECLWDACEQPDGCIACDQPDGCDVCCQPDGSRTGARRGDAQIDCSAPVDDGPPGLRCPGDLAVGATPRLTIDQTHERSCRADGGQLLLRIGVVRRPEPQSNCACDDPWDSETIEAALPYRLQLTGLATLPDEE